MPRKMISWVMSWENPASADPMRNIVSANNCTGRRP
jgi:hypothetical protein